MIILFVKIIIEEFLFHFVKLFEAFEIPNKKSYMLKTLSVAPIINRQQRDESAM